MNSLPSLVQSRQSIYKTQNSVDIKRQLIHLSRQRSSQPSLMASQIVRQQLTRSIQSSQRTFKKPPRQLPQINYFYRSTEKINLDIQKPSPKKSPDEKKQTSPEQKKAKIKPLIFKQPKHSISMLNTKRSFKNGLRTKSVAVPQVSPKKVEPLEIDPDDEDHIFQQSLKLHQNTQDQNQDLANLISLAQDIKKRGSQIDFSKIVIKNLSQQRKGLNQARKQAESILIDPNIGTKFDLDFQDESAEKQAATLRFSTYETPMMLGRILIKNRITPFTITFTRLKKQVPFQIKVSYKDAGFRSPRQADEIMIIQSGYFAIDQSVQQRQNPPTFKAYMLKRSQEKLSIEIIPRPRTENVYFQILIYDQNDDDDEQLHYLKVNVNYGPQNYNSIIKQEVDKERKFKIKQFTLKQKKQHDTGNAEHDEITNLLSGSNIKSKILGIIQDQDQSQKIISNLQFLKNKRKDQFQKRGNFIQKNAQNLKVNLKNEMWVSQYINKIDQKQKQVEMVNERNQILVERHRETKIFLINRKEILQKEKSELAIEIKNIIIRKCRHVHIGSLIKIQQIIRVIYKYWKIRVQQILINFKKKIKVAQIAKLYQNYVKKCKNLSQNKIKFTFNFAYNFITQDFQNPNVSHLLHDFLYQTSLRLRLKNTFDTYISRVLLIQIRFKLFKKSRQNLKAKLCQMFEKQIAAILESLKINTIQKKKKKGGEPLLDIRRMIENLPFYQVKVLSDTYMEQCREFQRQNYINFLKKKNQNLISGLEMISYQQSFKINFEEHTCHGESHEQHQVPQELLKVYSFKQIGISEDYEIQKYDAQKWQIIQNYLNKHYSNYQVESKEIIKKIEEYQQSNEFNKIKYFNSFIYEPTEPIMTILILNEVLPNNS